VTLHRFRTTLAVLTLAYIGLPYLVFFGGWLRPPYSALLLLVLAIGLAVAGRTFTRSSDASADVTAVVSLKTVALVVAPVLVIGVLLGAGGWGYQDLDWLKYNAILRDLMTRPWPVVYDIEGSPVMLTYYVGYLLPAAVVGKLFGWEAANHALFIYTLTGMSLSALWVWTLAGARAWWVVAVFLAFSGMDIVGQFISTVYRADSLGDGLRTMTDDLSRFEHMEWWIGWHFAQLSATTTLMVWVPNKATAAWLLTALMLSDAKARRLPETGLLYLGLCCLWCPFVTIGLLPVLAVLLYLSWREDGFRVQALWRLVSWPNVAGVAVALMVAVYLAGRFEPYALPSDWNGIYREHLTLTFLRLPELFLVRYTLFVMLEFLVLHALLYWYLALHKDVLSREFRALFVLSTALLLGLPILNFGYNNEPVMRSSIPVLFVTILVTIQVLGDRARGVAASWVKRAIVAVLVVGSVNGGVEVGRHAAGVYQRGALVVVPRQDEVRSLLDLQEMRYQDIYNFVSQYVGSADSRFVKYFAKQPVAQGGSQASAGAPTSRP
jgi:hypothetical protein